MAPAVAETLFVDTNILLTATDESRPLHDEAARFLAGSGPRGRPLVLSGQILREYLVVATRPPESNGLGLGARDAVANANEFLRHLHLVDETAEAARQLRRLARIHDLSGKLIHDANIIATMMAHGIAAVITRNARDFKRFEEIRVVGLDSSDAENC